MSLDPLAIVFEIVNFVVLVLILHRVLFKPVRDTIRKRREQIEKRSREMTEREAAVDELRQEYERRLSSLEEELGRRRSEALAEAEREASSVVSRAREEMGQRRQELDRELEEVRARLMTELAGDVARVAVEGARRILQESGGVELTLAHVQRAAEHLRENRGDRLAGTLVRAWVPADAEFEAVHTTLAERLGPAVRLEIRADPGLVGGVRLLHGDFEIEASASATLARWLDEIRNENPPGENPMRATGESG